MDPEVRKELDIIWKELEELKNAQQNVSEINAENKKTTALQTKERGGQSDDKHNETKENTKKLMQSIDRTKYPLMFNLKTVLDRALYLLKIAKDDFEVDGLLSSQIATLLSDKFRLKTTQYSVSMALMNATKLVDRKPVVIRGAKAYIYLLMHEGEESLKKLMQGASKEDNKGGLGNV